MNTKEKEWIAVNILGWQRIRPEEIGMHRSNATAYYKLDKADNLSKFVMNDINWKPDTIYEQAFMVVAEMRKSSYKRKRFMQALKSVVCESRGIKNMPYKDMLFWMSPETICKAAIEASDG